MPLKPHQLEAFTMTVSEIQSTRRNLLEWEDDVARSMINAGASWADVGTAFATSRQAAQQRFGWLVEL